MKLLHKFQNEVYVVYGFSRDGKIPVTSPDIADESNWYFTSNLQLNQNSYILLSITGLY